MGIILSPVVDSLLIKVENRFVNNMQGLSVAAYLSGTGPQCHPEEDPPSG